MYTMQCNTWNVEQQEMLAWQAKSTDFSGRCNQAIN